MTEPEPPPPPGVLEYRRTPAPARPVFGTILLLYGCIVGLFGAFLVIWSLSEILSLLDPPDPHYALIGLVVPVTLLIGLVSLFAAGVWCRAGLGLISGRRNSASGR